MKVGKEHRVPLTDAALRLVAALPKIAGSDLIFSAGTGGPLSDMSLIQVMRRMDVAAVPHGFRSTFRDWAGERTNHPRESPSKLWHMRLKTRRKLLTVAVMR